MSVWHTPSMKAVGEETITASSRRSRCLHAGQNCTTSPSSIPHGDQTVVGKSTHVACTLDREWMFYVSKVPKSGFKNAQLWDYTTSNCCQMNWCHFIYRYSVRHPFGDLTIKLFCKISPTLKLLYCVFKCYWQSVQCQLTISGPCKTQHFFFKRYIFFIVCLTNSVIHLFAAF